MVRGRGREWRLERVVEQAASGLSDVKLIELLLHRWLQTHTEPRWTIESAPKSGMPIRRG